MNEGKQTGKNEIKQEPVFMQQMWMHQKNSGTRCGFEFTNDHLFSCKAKNEHCRSCSMTGYFPRKCRIEKSDKSRGRGRNTNRARMRRVNLIGRDDGQSETGSEYGEDKMVLHLNGCGNQNHS